MINQQIIQNKCLKVSGEGTIYVSPDQANITLGAITEGKILQQAQQENAMIISNIITAMTSLGIPKEKIQTVTYQIDIMYDYKDGVQIFRGYRVTHQLLVKTDNVEQAGKIVDTAVNQGANSVTNIEFTLAHPESYYNEALKIALHTAYVKAFTLTSQLSVHLNPVPYKIEEASQFATPPIPYATTLMAKAEATPIQSGQIAISATIIAHYLYC